MFPGLQIRDLGESGRDDIGIGHMVKTMEIDALFAQRVVAHLDLDTLLLQFIQFLLRLLVRVLEQGNTLGIEHNGDIHFALP